MSSSTGQRAVPTPNGWLPSPERPSPDLAKREGVGGDAYRSERPQDRTRSAYGDQLSLLAQLDITEQPELFLSPEGF